MRKEDAIKKEDVIEIMRKNMSGCYTCCFSCDRHGFNGAFSSTSVEDLLIKEDQFGCYNVWSLLADDWELYDFEPVTNEDIDIDEWAQEFDKDTIDYLRKDIDTGGYYIATFCSEYYGTQRILVW